MRSTRRRKAQTLTIVHPTRIDDIVRALHAGQVAAIPTDTVYGIAAALDCPDAIRRLAELKGRTAKQPIALLIGSVTDVTRHLENPTVLDRVNRFWPGALTAVVHVRSDSLLEPPIVTTDASGSKTMGIRQPNDELARVVISGCDGALVVTSANRHGEPPATSAMMVEAAFGTGMPVLNGGTRIGGVASTVVDLTVDPPRILREGSISAMELGLAAM